MRSDRVGRFTAVALLLVLALLPTTREALAHASLTGSDPPDGASLAEPPGALVLSFNEPVRPVRLRLVDGAGVEVALMPEIAAGEAITSRPAAPLPRGGYVLSWRATSADGHPVSGALAFGVGAAASAQAAAVEATPAASPVRFAAEVLRLLALLVPGGLALLLAIGGATGGAGGVGTRALRRLCLTAAALLVLSTGLSGTELAGTGPAGLASLDAWGIALGTSVGRAGLAGLAGLGLIALATVAAPAPRALALAAGGIVTLGALTLTGHAASAPPAGAGVVLMILHAALAALWLAALPLLRRRVRGGPAAGAAPVLASFSRWAQPAVMVLLAAGVGLAVLQLRRPEAAWGTTYGRIWMAKLALVAPLLGLALLNRHRLTPRLARGEDAARGAVRRSIGAEMALIAAVLALTAGLATVPPPRALTLPTAPVTAALTGAGGAGEAVLEPGRPGRNRLRVRLTGPDGAALALGDVPRVELTHPALAGAALARPMLATGPGAGETDVELPLAGTWTVTVVTYPTTFDQVRLSGGLALGGTPSAAAVIAPEDGPPVHHGAHH